MVSVFRDRLVTGARSIGRSLSEKEIGAFEAHYHLLRVWSRRMNLTGLKQEEQIDQAARQKIESQRRIILEGTQEWEILYRKYYNEEVKKLGI